jgi:amino acid adenylation domain-containing protein
VPSDEPLLRLGLDSLAAVELKGRVEERLGVAVSLASVLGGIDLAGLVRDLLAGLAEEPVAEGPALAPAAPLTGDLPLSVGQRALWFLDRLAPAAAAYHIAAAAHVRPAPDPAVLCRAVEHLVARHLALRATFHELRGEPHQRIHPALAPAFFTEDAATWGEVELVARLTQEAYRPFDLETGPLLRLGCFERGNDEAVLLLAVHHLVADFRSLATLTRELGALYAAGQASAPRRAPVDLPPPALTYLDCVRWQNSRLAGAEGERLWSYWRERLSPPPPALELATDRPRPPVQGFRGGARALTLPAELGPAAAALARANGTTLFTLLLAAFQALLHRLSRQDDFAVGSPAAGRGRPELADIVGYFVNPVALRADLAGEPTFAGLLARARRSVAADLARQDYPFALLAERLQPERGGRSPLFQAMFVLQRAEGPEESGLVGFALGLGGARAALGGLALESIALLEQASQLDLTLRMGEVEGSLAASLQYDADLFDGTTAGRLLGHLRELLAAAVAEPERSVSLLPLLSAAEREELLASWNRTAAAAPRDLCLHELCAAQAVRTPDAVVLIAGERRSTYGELDARAGRLARGLRRRGVGAESRVGVHLARSEEMVVALLAVLKAGGAYVPLDPALPAERLALLACDAGIGVVLTREGLGAALPAGVRQLSPIVDSELPAEEGTKRLPPRAEPGNLAYVIYTSGSTGRPKGVGIEHRSAVELVSWARGVFSEDELSGVLASTSIGFDLSVFEIFVPLSWGGKVILAENALELPTLAAAPEVRLINTVPSAMAELVAGDLPPALATVNLAGEALSPALVARLHRHPQVTRVVNLYGPTEDTTYSTWIEVPRRAARVTIGGPVSNTRAYLLDRVGEPAPVGIPAELHLAGAGLARGYLGRPELTAERFVPDPFGGVGERMYRTGDLARRLPSGEIDFLGRIDRQVKLRGFRIELGEIEVALAACPGVAEAAVVVRERGTGDRALLACVVVGSAAAPSAAELRGILDRTLPSYMVPGSFAFLPALPLTPNGKVDRKALLALEPETAGGTEARRAPTTPVEDLIAGIFAEVLGVERVGMDAGFFDLGGHSLSAMRLVARVRETLGVELPVRAVFEAASAAGLAVRVEQELGAGGARLLPSIEPVPRDRPLPLSFAQQRLWFLDRLEPGSAAYNIAVAIGIDGRLQPAVLAAALGEMAHRHEPLRTRLVESTGGPVQAIDPPGPVPLPMVDLGELSSEREEAESRHLARAEALRPFDLGRGPLLRATLLEYGEGEHRLLLTVHHVVADGWSLEVLVRELGVLYAAFARGEASPLAALPIQYADYAVWQRRWLTEETLAGDLAYWRERLTGAAVLDLPTDSPRPPVQSFRGGRVPFAVDGALLADLRTLARREGATLFMALLGGFQALLSRYAGQEDVSVGTPVAGRMRRETEELIGLFVNTLVLRLDLAGEPGFGEVLRRVREVALGAYAHQELPFERLVEALSPERSLAVAPLFQAMLGLQRAAAVPSWAAAGLALAALEPEEGTAKFDLHLGLSEHLDRLAGSLEYASDLFERTTAIRLGEHLRRLLASAAAAPDRPVAELSLLSAVEESQLAEWQGPAGDYPGDLCLHGLFERQASRTPEAEAVVGEGKRLSYGELDRRANRLARQLRRLGVGPEARAGVLLRRTPEMVVALLAVLKAGGAYVPFDATYPRERLAFMAADAGLTVLVSEERLAAALQVSGVPLLVLDADQTWLEEDDSALPPLATTESLAYLIYTSGSTGRPKAVAIAHRSPVALAHWARQVFTPEDLAGVLASTSIGFDLSVCEIFVPLSWGGRVILAEDALDLPSLAARAEVTLVNTVPSAMAELVSGDLPPRLAVVNLAGEALAPLLVERIYRHPQVARVVNLYGPTEDTTYSTWVEVPRGAVRVTIGRPIAETQAHLLDRRLASVPVGVVGELYLAGQGLARGYLGRPELTAARFVPNPFDGAGGRMYRTGDLARRLPSGEIEFLGRIDRQVKLRGFRIELGEIEAALAGHPEIREAAVVLWQGDREPRLIGYVVPERKTPSAGELRSYLQAKLSTVMVPPVFVSLPELPRTANGKVEHRALPEPSESELPSVRERVAPRSDLEELLTEIWAQVLDLEVEALGVHDNFFEIGGHSLKAMQVISQIRQKLELELPVRSVFTAPTVAEFAVAVVAHLAQEAGDEALIETIAEVNSVAGCSAHFHSP